MIRPICLATGMLIAAVILLSGECLAGGENLEDTEAATGTTLIMDSRCSISSDKTDAGDGAVSPLAGTEWRLVSFQSMDDGIGEIHPKDPSMFTMQLHPDGNTSLRLGCNRARGTWSVKPSGDGTSGRFSFSQLTSTRALCSPPHLDKRIVVDAEFVRGYLLREGRLYLSLMADGGIYAWEPLEASVSGR